jgi:hypothetical protein
MPSDLSTIPHPLLYEINTWPWLEAISRTEGRVIDLGSVPARYWDEIAEYGFDGVWLMGVWQRSPAGIAIALSNDNLRESFSAMSERSVVSLRGHRSPQRVRVPQLVWRTPGARSNQVAIRAVMLGRGAEEQPQLSVAIEKVA